MLQDIKIFRFEELKKIHRDLRHNFEENFSLRIHRGLSWIKKAEKELSDPDASFIFNWIAFNSIYADIEEKEISERGKFNRFFIQVIELDEKKDNKLYNLLWIKFFEEIKSLLNNQFIFQPFWNHMIEENAPNWEQSFKNANKRVAHALREQNSMRIVSILMERLYVLRNQLMHGGATWSGSKNREQVIDGSKFMRDFVPCLVEIMMKNPDKDWGNNNYPILRASKDSLQNLFLRFNEE